MKRKRNDAWRRRARPREDRAAGAPQPAMLALRVRQIAFGVALIAAGLGPLAPTFEGDPILRLIIQMFFLLAGMLWVIAMALEGRARIRRTGLEACLLLLAGALLCSTFNAVYKYPAILTLFSWLSAMVGFVFLVNETRSRRRRLLVLLVVGASALVVSLHGLHQITVDLPRARSLFAQDRYTVLRDLRLPEDAAYDLEGRLGTSRIFSTFLLPNSLAGFLLLVAPALIGLCLDGWKSRRLAGRNGAFGLRAWSDEGAAPSGGTPGRATGLILRAGLVLPALLALYCTKSKGGGLAFFLAAGVFAVWAFGEWLWRRRLRVLCVCLGLLIVWSLAQASGLLPPLRDYLGSSSVRYAYWRAGVLTFAEHPVMGVGLDNFPDFYASKKEPGDEEARRAHNDYIQLAAETGIIGLTLYAAFWAVFWRRVRRMKGEPILAEAEPSRLDGAGAAGLMALGMVILGLEAICGGALHTASGFWNWQWLFALWAGWTLFVLLHLQGQDPLVLGRFSYAAIGLGCGVIGFLAHSFVDFDHYVGGTLQTAWILMALLLSARMSEEGESFVVDRRMTPGWRLACVIGPAAVVLFVLYGFVRPVAESESLRDRALDPVSHRSAEQSRLDLEEAAEKNPLDAQTRALLSDVYLAQWLQGRPNTAQNVSPISQAILNVKAAIELDPMRSEYYARLGRLYEIQWRERRLKQDYLDAKDAYTRAYDLFPSNPDARLNLARLDDLAGDSDLALVRYMEARRLGEQQYHIPRQFNADEVAELNARIRVLRDCHLNRTQPPPPDFHQARLQGWPRQMAALAPRP